MPSTYTLNNGIELIGTGEQSGTWGDTTNTNLELLDTALDGQVTITATSAGSSSSPNDLPISDGSASNGRNRMVIITSATDLGADVYYQLTPNDAEKIIYVRNDLNTQDLVLFQGTYNASNAYTVPNGKTAVIFFDGGGAGAVAANVFNNAHFDALNVAGTSTFNDDVTFTGASYNVIWDKSDNALEFADNAKAKFGNGSDLQIYHDGFGSFIKDSGTGNLQIDCGDFRVRKVDGSEAMIQANQDGAVNLFYDGGATPKLATTSTGVDITGTAVTDGLTSSGVLSVDADAISEIKSGIASDVLRLGNDAGTYVLGYASALGSMDLGASDNFRIRHGSTESFRATPTGVVLNEIGVSTVDFRVESDNNTHALFVDSSADQVSVDATFIADTGTGTQTFNITRSGQTDQTLQMWVDDANVHIVSAQDESDISYGGYYFKSTNGLNSNKILLYMNQTQTTFNEAGDDVNFRVEGTSDPNLINADAGNNTVGVGVSPSADAKFHIDGGSTPTEYFRGGTNNRRHLKISSYDTGSLDAGHNLNASSVSGQLTLSASGGEHMRIDAVTSSSVFNETGADQDFRVEGDTNSHALFVDGATSTVSIGGQIPSSYYLNVVSSQRITGGTGALLVQATNASSGNHVATIDVSTLSERGSHMSLVDDDGREFGIKRDYSGGSPITRAIIYADDGTTQRSIMDWGQAGNYVIFNEEGNDMDFRVESDTNANAIFVDAGENAVGILTNSVTGYDFNVAGNATKLNSHIWSARGYSVPTATDVDIYWNNANQQLDTYYVYRWLLTTTGTGTDTGAIYHATFANGSWSLFIESRSSTSSNSPQLKIDAATGKAQIFHNHPSTYSINVLCEAKYVGNNNNLGTAIGLASYWNFLWSQEGMIGNDSGSSSFDFRIESGNENAMLFLDADQDQVRLCTTAQLYTTTRPKLEIYDNTGSAGGVGVKLQSGTNASYAGYNYWGRVNGSGTTHYAFAFYDGPSGTSEGSITVTSSGTSYNTTSDYRLKENVVELTGATERLKQLEPKRFNFIKEGDTPTVDGFMAHEVQTVVPEAVTGTHNEVDDDGNPVYQGIDQSKLVPLLVATIKELEARITALENA